MGGAGQRLTGSSRSRRANAVRSLSLVVLAILAHDLMMLDAGAAHGAHHGTASVEHTAHHVTWHPVSDHTLSGQTGHPSSPDDDGPCGVVVEAIRLVAGHQTSTIDADRAAVPASSRVTGSHVPAGSAASAHDPTLDPQVKRALLQIFRV